MAWNRAWEKIFQEKEWGKYPAESLIRFIAKNFYQTDRGKVRILEIGCGPGGNIWYLGREGFDVYGMDGSPTAIKKAKLRMCQEGLRADLKTGDIINLPYQNNYFDAVIDVECLYSNSREDAESILRAVNRVLKKRGIFFSRTFAKGTYIGKSRKKVGDSEYTHISDGPLAGECLVRLMDNKQARALYGRFFKVVSIDKLESTLNGGSIKVSELIVVCKKKD